MYSIEIEIMIHEIICMCCTDQSCTRLAVLVTSVVRTRMQDMQTMMNQNQEQAPKENQNGGAGDSSVLMDETVLPESDREIAEKL